MIYLFTFAALFVLLILFLAWRVRQMSFNCLRLKVDAADSLSESQRAFLNYHLTLLEPLGFTAYSTVHLPVSQQVTAYGVLLRGPTAHTHGLLLAGMNASAPTETWLSLITSFIDGTVLETDNRTALRVLSLNPRVDSETLPQASYKELTEKHDRRVNERPRGETPVALSPEEVVSLAEADAQEYYRFLESRGEIVWIDETRVYRFSFLVALKGVIKHLSNRTRPGIPPLSMKPDGSSDYTPDVEVAVDQYLKTIPETKTRRNKAMRAVLFVVSIVIFFVSYVIYSGGIDWYGPLIFTAVILLHEGGHVLAMSFFGCKDPVVLFVPFLGAIATAKNLEHATRWQHFWILLAGPLPGIVLGIGLIASVELGWLPETNQYYLIAVSTLFLLNGFNLLPVYPLDGGQIVHSIFLARWPYFSLLFKSISVLLLMLFGVRYENPLFSVFAVLIALSIPGQFRIERLKKVLYREVGAEIAAARKEVKDDRDLPRLVLAKLQHPPFNRLSFQQQSILVKDILSRSDVEKYSWLIVTALFAVYAGAVGLVTSAILYALVLRPFFTTYIGDDANVPSVAQALRDEPPYYAEGIPPLNGKLERSSPVAYVCGENALRVKKVDPERHDEDNDDEEEMEVSAGGQLVGTFSNAIEASHAFDRVSSSLPPETENVLLIGRTLVVSYTDVVVRDRIKNIMSEKEPVHLMIHREDPYHDYDYTNESFADTAPVMVNLSATAPSEEDARHTVNLLGFFLGFFTNDLALAPWQDLSVTPGQREATERARYTYWKIRHIERARVVGEARRPSFLSFSLLKLLWSSVFVYHSSLTEEEHARLLERFNSLISDLKELGLTDSRIDRSVIEYYIERLQLRQKQSSLRRKFWVRNKAAQQQQSATVEDKLLQKGLRSKIMALDNEIFKALWQQDIAETNRNDSNDTIMRGAVAGEGQRVSLQEMQFNNIYHALPLLLDYFCDKRFTNIELSFSQEKKVEGEGEGSTESLSNESAAL